MKKDKMDPLAPLTEEESKNRWEGVCKVKFAKQTRDFALAVVGKIGEVIHPSQGTTDRSGLIAFAISKWHNVPTGKDIVCLFKLNKRGTVATVMSRQPVPRDQWYGPKDSQMVCTKVERDKGGNLFARHPETGQYIIIDRSAGIEPGTRTLKVRYTWSSPLVCVSDEKFEQVGEMGLMVIADQNGDTNRPHSSTAPESFILKVGGQSMNVLAALGIVEIPRGGYFSDEDIRAIAKDRRRVMAMTHHPDFRGQDANVELAEHLQLVELAEEFMLRRNEWKRSVDVNFGISTAPKPSDARAVIVQKTREQVDERAERQKKEAERKARRQGSGQVADEGLLQQLAGKFSGGGVEKKQSQQPDSAKVPSIPVKKIAGIGPAYERKLLNAGIKSVQRLRNTDVSRLADIMGVSEQKARDFVSNAKTLIAGEKLKLSQTT